MVSIWRRTKTELYRLCYAFQDEKRGLEMVIFRTLELLSKYLINFTLVNIGHYRNSLWYALQSLRWHFAGRRERWNVVGRIKTMSWTCSWLSESTSRLLFQTKSSGTLNLAENLAMVRACSLWLTRSLEMEFDCNDGEQKIVAYGKL